MSSDCTCSEWRRRRDSNPRDPFEPNGFQDRRFQPLTHSSVSKYNVQQPLAGFLVTFLTTTIATNKLNQRRGTFLKKCSAFFLKQVFIWRFAVRSPKTERFLSACVNLFVLDSVII